MKYTYLLTLCVGVFRLIAMDDQIARELSHERVEQIQEKLGANVCRRVLAAWNTYEKRFLVTILESEKWHRCVKGEPICFAGGKKIFRDYFCMKIDNKTYKIPMEEFKVLAELDRVPQFSNYNAEVIKFDNLREHFETEDEIWDQLNRQLGAQ